MKFRRRRRKGNVFRILVSLANFLSSATNIRRCGSISVYKGLDIFDALFKRIPLKPIFIVIIFVPTMVGGGDIRMLEITRPQIARSGDSENSQPAISPGRQISMRNPGISENGDQNGSSAPNSSSRTRLQVRIVVLRRITELYVRIPLVRDNNFYHRRPGNLSSA
jgi:hypothetical protein